MNLNVRRMKYVIAREGLILIFLMAAASISYYGDHLCNSKIDNYVKTAKEIELPMGTINSDPFEAARTRLDAKKANGHDGYTLQYGVKIITDPKIQFPKSTTKEVIEKTLDRDFLHNVGVLDRLAFLYDMVVSDQPSNLNIINRYDDKGNKLFTGLLWQIDFLKIMTFFLFIAYPSYILVRFVAWAVITVKSSGTTH